MLIVFFLVSIVFSFMCSIWEAVLLSIPPSFVEVHAQKGTQTGKLLKTFKKDIDKPLAAILTLNTIAHTVGAIGVGAQASKIWGQQPVSTIGVPVLMTLAILILSEIIPKTIGANNWRDLASFTVKSLRWVGIILYPLVWVSTWITKGLKKNKSRSVFSRSDFSVMADIGLRDGVFEKQEGKILQSLLKFGNVEARDIMTPRTVMIAADETKPIKEFYETYPLLRFSRIPIYQEDLDHVTGFVLKHDILSSILGGKGEEPLKTISRDLMHVEETTDMPDLFNTLMEKREHIALVVDKFGGTSGIVTMEDVIETLLGLEIVDELDKTVDMQKLARQNWEDRAKEMGILDNTQTTPSADQTDQ